MREMRPLHPDQSSCRFLHSWLAERSGASLRAWSAATGTGAEARSFAAMCDEYAVDAFVLATDADQNAISVARTTGFEGSATVEYRVHPLTEPLDEHGTFDVILLRGILADLDPAARVRTLARVEANLRENGLLVLDEDLDPDLDGTGLEPVHSSIFVRSTLVRP